jgi:hypothetical protein
LGKLNKNKRAIRTSYSAFEAVRFLTNRSKQTGSNSVMNI